jgi:hypothetical protein
MLTVKENEKKGPGLAKWEPHPMGMVRLTGSNPTKIDRG